MPRPLRAPLAPLHLDLHLIHPLFHPPSAYSQRATIDTDTYVRAKSIAKKRREKKRWKKNRSYDYVRFHDRSIFFFILFLLFFFFTVSSSKIRIKGFSIEKKKKVSLFPRYFRFLDRDGYAFLRSRPRTTITRSLIAIHEITDIRSIEGTTRTTIQDSSIGPQSKPLTPVRNV